MFSYHFNMRYEDRVSPLVLQWYSPLFGSQKSKYGSQLFCYIVQVFFPACSETLPDRKSQKNKDN